MSDSLSREQLLDYIKKQKLKIKKLELKTSELATEVETLKFTSPTEHVAIEGNNNDELEDCFEKISALEEDLAAKNKELKDLQNSTKNRIKLLENENMSKSQEVNELQSKISEDVDVLMEHLNTISMLKDAFNNKHSAWEQQTQLVSDLQGQLTASSEELAATTAPPLPSVAQETTAPCTRCITLEQAVSDFEKIVEEKTAEIETQSQHIAATNAQVQDLLEEITSLKKDLEAATQSRTDALNSAEARARALDAELVAAAAGEEQARARATGASAAALARRLAL